MTSEIRRRFAGGDSPCADIGYRAASSYAIKSVDIDECACHARRRLRNRFFSFIRLAHGGFSHATEDDHQKGCEIECGPAPRRRGGLSIAGPALADGIGNSVHNCYGIWWNTDWDQRCSSPGASYAGRYKSVADCTSSGDNSLTVRRNQYSTLSHDGPDCTFQTVNVTTSYLGS